MDSLEKHFRSWRKAQDTVTRNDSVKGVSYIVRADKTKIDRMSENNQFQEQKVRWQHLQKGEHFVKYRKKAINDKYIKSKRKQ